MARVERSMSVSELDAGKAEHIHQRTRTAMLFGAERAGTTQPKTKAQMMYTDGPSAKRAKLTPSRGGEEEEEGEERKDAPAAPSSVAAGGGGGNNNTNGGSQGNITVKDTENHVMNEEEEQGREEHEEENAVTTVTTGGSGGASSRGVLVADVTDAAEVGTPEGTGVVTEASKSRQQQQQQQLLMQLLPSDSNNVAMALTHSSEEDEVLVPCDDDDVPKTTGKRKWRAEVIENATTTTTTIAVNAITTTTDEEEGEKDDEGNMSGAAAGARRQKLGDNAIDGSVDDANTVHPMMRVARGGATAYSADDLDRLIRSTACDTSAARSKQRTKPSPPNRPDDKDGHYVYELGENLTPRYKIMNKLGEGTFGRVIECWDRQRKEYCAIKIIRNVRKYRNAAKVELEVLKKLRENDKDDSRHCVRLTDWFDYRNHICMVFERLGLSLYDFLLKNHYHPFNVDEVRDFAFQLLVGVGYVHSLDLVHTDLKPENILLRALEYVKVPLPNSKHCRRIPKSTDIKLIDFGSAAFVDDRHASIVSTRHYRAPEVILGLGWTFSCDLWSIGCILVELVTGIVLFNTHDNLEHLAMMEKILGDIPKTLVQAADECKETKGFFDNSLLNWPQGKTSSESRKAVRKLSQLHELLVAVEPSKEREMLQLADLVKKLMCFEASKRISAENALEHPFFDGCRFKQQQQQQQQQEGHSP